MDHNTVFKRCPLKKLEAWLGG